MSVAVVQYNAGNTLSVCHALARLGVSSVLTNDPAELRRASHVIFPGVGEARSAMQSVRTNGLEDVIPELCQPVLGICLGMQLFCEYSEENDTCGLAVFPDAVCRFAGKELKVPHMGWNTLENLEGPLFADIPPSSYVYFAHSYRVPPSERAIATASYEGTFAAALQRDNFFGVQFHPEKSGTVGAQLLQNFLRLS